MTMNELIRTIAARLATVEGKLETEERMGPMADTEKLSQNIERCQLLVTGSLMDGQDKIRDLEARLRESYTERDHARAEVERLREALKLSVREMERASMVGEIHFRTNALASGVAIGLGEALFTASAALKGSGT